ncbi:ABC transporter domain-containing protein [Caenorhabditis elegans]|nr:ABC transporter domain-containing protein [Caenorhabditis elegans]CDO41153.1 ABC transporter domain-containing protein [Caenorhabditis elegans]|eukprot:NP_001293361.1 ABC Transporter family [Caenorhabditis elegans]
MVGFWRQLNFLLWKCVLVRRRQKFWLAVELIVPCILFIIIALVRTKDFSEASPQCHYDSKGMLSAGVLPFIHSFFCSFSNRCNAAPTTGDEKHFLFNDDGEHTRNESIIVDAIYYSSLQLRWIGNNPKKFEDLTKGAAEIVHWLAGKSLQSTAIVRLGDLFDEPIRQNLTKVLNTTGLKMETAEKLLNARLEPGAIETFQTLRTEISFTDLFFSENPLFCDERMFESTFSFEKGQELTNSEKDELCSVLSLTTLMDFSGYMSEVRLPTLSRLRVTPFISSFQSVFEPTLIFAQKYGNYSTDQLLLALFCGEDPRATIEQTINPNSDKNVDTPFEKLRKQVIKFIQTVTPGKEQEKNSTCTPVPHHQDMNCSSLESPILMKVREALSGYILVTPDNPVTRRVVDRLNIPLRDIEHLRNLLYTYPSDALEFQDRLHASDLWPASQKLLHFIKVYKNGQNQLNTRTIHFFLEHLFAPSSDEYSFGTYTKNITEIANKYTGCFLLDRFRFVTDEKELETNAVCLMDTHQYFTGIVFNIDSNATEFDGFTTYKIRHYPEMVDSTTSFMDSKSNPFSRDKPLIDLKYITFGFSFLQESIDRAIMSELTNQTDANLGVYAQQEPYPCTVKDTFNVALFMPLFLLISFIFPSALLVKNIVYEKEQKIKEQMRAMGLGDAVHFISWGLISLVLNFISVLIISIISKVAKIFDYTDYTLLLFVLILFLFSSIAMSIFFSTLFTNANIATAATCVLWFVFFIPFQLLRTDRISSPTFNRISLILPPTAMGHCFKLLESFNAMERATWSDLWEMNNPVLGISVELCMIMLVVDTAVFLILAWYISAVAPGDFGVRQPLWFPFTLKYWAPGLYKNRVEFVDDEHFDTIPNSDSFDSEPTNLTLAVHINSMSKVYENGTKALDCLNLRLYEGQITGLLGHNGAGKTTTMSILCGLYAPSSGTAKIYQRDIRTDLRRVRDVLGICPQHNVLFSHLTVSEQLRLFAALKGVPDSELTSQVDEILASVSLTEKANKLASTLSGGMKRRLCIGIAFIGGSRFVILDEPTAGVDVTARKDIWKLLQRNKEGRTILLSTHHMDEADVLSDRIAILSQDFEKPDLLDGKRLIFQHFYALLVCRINYTLKSKRTFLFQVIIPLFLLALAELFVLLQVSTARPDLMVSMPPLPLETSIMGNHSDFYVNSWDTAENSTANDILHAMFSSPGTGPRCAKDVPNDLLDTMRRELMFRNRYGFGRNKPAPGVDKDSVDNEYQCQNIQGEFDYTEDISNATYNAPIYCGCEDFGWNCTLEDWKWNETNWLRLNTTDRIFDLTGRNLTQFRLITRFAQLANTTAPFFLGGFSLGHVNQRAQSQADIDTSKRGWLETIKDIAQSMRIINLNTTGIEPATPKVLDPFAQNITLNQVVNDLLQNLDVRENVKVWFNNKIWPGFPIASNILSNALLRQEDYAIDPEDLGILTMNHPMNKTISQTLDQNALKFTQALAVFRITILLLVLSMIPAGFTVYLVEDRICEALHLQLVGGLRKVTYWVTSYLYDMVVYTLVIIVIMLIYLCFRVSDFTADGATFFAFLLLFFVHGMSTILYAYVFQKAFSVAALSFVLIAIGSYFVGIVCALTVIMLESLMVQDPSLIPAHTVCSIVFLVLPQYNLGIAIFRGLMIYQVRAIGSNFLQQMNRPDMINQLPLPSLLAFDQMGIHIMCLFIHVIIATICLIFSQMDEFGFVRKRERNLTDAMMLREPSTCDDEDVVKERQRVDAIPMDSSDNHALIVRNLAKAYNPELLAVKGISFAVEPGECFGLLGLNGAGKTTTFAMLTAKIRPGHGSIEMQNTRINTGSFSDVRNFQQLGYCPQFDALNMKLSTRENLKFYARIRGIVPTQIDSIIDRLLIALHLRPYANTQTSSLSGGNRRKLSVAVALVSQPSLIFLDEPSAGMDPGSQQFLWKVIERLCKSGKAVVLTSHSMEECEALCTRIAIMDRGRIRCLGGKQHLKSKYGKGSMLTMKMGKDENAKEIAGIMRSKLGDGSRVEAIHCSTIFIHIEQGTASVARVLEIVNQVKKMYDVDDFTLTQSTLDNVFQSIAESDNLSEEGHHGTLSSINRNNTASTYVIHGSDQ